MTTTRSLLYRLENYQEEVDRDLPGNPGLVIDSICRHLQVMLNSRVGTSLTVPDFGTPDFTELSRGLQKTQKFQEELRRCIDKYELRLKDVQVTFTPDESKPFTMHFDIKGTMIIDGEERPTRFRSTVQNTGKVEVVRR